MVLNIVKGRLAVYTPDRESDATTPNDILKGTKTGLSANIEHSVGGVKDHGTFTLGNNKGDYTDLFVPGSRIEFWYEQGQTTATSGTFGGDPYGSVPYGGLGEERWAGVVTNITLTNHGVGRRSMTVEATDYVGGILGMREVYDAFESRSVVGSVDAIVPSLIRRKCPELDPTPLESLPDLGTTDMFITGEDLFKVVTRALARVDCYLITEGTSVGAVAAGRNVSPEYEPEVQWELKPTDHAGGYENRITSDGMVNELRLNGGTGTDIGFRTLAEGDTPVDTVRVTDSDRIMVQVSPEKTRYDRIEVWTQQSESEEEAGVTVRLQRPNADGTGPLAPEDGTKDLDSKNLSKEFISHDDYTTFLLSGNVLPARPWLIIESDGPEGHLIGLSSGSGLSGTPAIKTWYPYPVNVRVHNQDSIESYLLREDSMNDDSLTTFNAANDAGFEELRHHDQPMMELAFAADSPRAHALLPGDVIRADYPTEKVVGRWIVTDVTDDFETATVTTDITAQAVASL